MQIFIINGMEINGSFKIFIEWKNDNTVDRMFPIMPPTQDQFPEHIGSLRLSGVIPEHEVNSGHF